MFLKKQGKEENKLDATFVKNYIPKRGEIFTIVDGLESVDAVFLLRRDGNLVLCTKKIISSMSVGYWNWYMLLEDIHLGKEYPYHITFYPHGYFEYEHEVKRIADSQNLLFQDKHNNSNTKCETGTLYDIVSREVRRAYFNGLTNKKLDNTFVEIAIEQIEELFDK